MNRTVAAAVAAPILRTSIEPARCAKSPVSAASKRKAVLSKCNAVLGRCTACAELVLDCRVGRRGTDGRTRLWLTRKNYASEGMNLHLSKQRQMQSASAAVQQSKCRVNAEQCRANAICATIGGGWAGSQVVVDVIRCGRDYNLRAGMGRTCAELL